MLIITFLVMPSLTVFPLSTREGSSLKTETLSVLFTTMSSVINPMPGMKE